MKEVKSQKNDSSYQELSENLNNLLRIFLEKLKFKKGEHWSKKVLKVLLRIISILILIALSPLILITVLMVMAFIL